jgi:hypothetical protein
VVLLLGFLISVVIAAAFINCFDSRLAVSAKTPGV